MTKPVIITLLSLLCIGNTFAQLHKPDSTIYYEDKMGLQTTVRDSAFFYTVITAADNGLYTVRQYTKNHNLMFATSSKSKKIRGMKFEGVYTSYHLNGFKRKIRNYENGVFLGDETTYYPNGKLAYIKLYNNGKDLLLDECHDTTGRALAQHGEGTWLEYHNDMPGPLSVEGQVKQGQREGEWVGKLNDSVNFVDSYAGNIIYSTKLFDNSGAEVTEAIFGLGRNAFSTYITNRVNTAGNSFIRSVRGRVLISFVIEKDGTLNNVRVIDSLEPDLDAVAVAAVKNSPRWKPATVYSQPIRMEYSVPVFFRIN